MTVTAIHLTVHGLVQNVGYRNWTEELAEEHGVTGWVRNLRNGTVEMLLCGEAEAVAHVHKACEKGPNRAHVTRVDVHFWNKDIPEDFQRLPTPEDSGESFARMAT